VRPNLYSFIRLILFRSIWALFLLELTHLSHFLSQQGLVLMGIGSRASLLYIQPRNRYRSHRSDIILFCLVKDMEVVLVELGVVVTVPWRIYGGNDYARLYRSS
jgi:hypothetical protein